jgi:mannitol-specific phosphotransferase system IIBC component
MTRLAKLIALTLSLTTGSVSSVYAAQKVQDNEKAIIQLQTSGEQQQFDDSTLEKFTVAMYAVQDVAKEFEVKLQQEQSTEKQQQLQANAREAMVDEIEQAGLEVKTYTTIAQLVRQDEALRQRVMNIVNDQDNS